MYAHPLMFDALTGEQPQQKPQPEQPAQPEQPEQPEQKEVKDWDKYVPGFVDQFAKGYMKKSEKATAERVKEREEAAKKEQAAKKGSDEKDADKSPSLMYAHPLMFDALTGEQPQQKPQPEQPAQPEQPEQPEQKEVKDWDKYVPGFVDQFAKGYMKKSEKATAERVKEREEAAKKEQAAKKGSGEKDAPALLVASDDASDEAQEEQSLRAVSSAEESEAKAKSRAEDALGRLHEASAQGVIGEVSDWSTVEELASSTTEKDASSWEHALEERTQMLEKFNSKPRKNLLDFNASRAVELVYAVQTASAHVELNIRRRQEKMKSAFKDAKYAAMRKVKAMEFDTRDAARNWKALGKKAVKAQRAAHISENVYERHEDLMRDAAGDVSNRAENRADRLKDQVSDYFSRVEDDLHRSSFDKRGRDLMKRAKEAVAQMHEVTEKLGAQAAYQEAESSARFQQEEKRWESYQSPKMLLAMPSAALSSSMMLTTAGSFAVVFALLRRRRHWSRPLDIEAPPLLG